MKLEPLLYVKSLRTSVEFYQQVLGFELGELYPNEDNPTYAPIYIDEYKLRLVQGGDRMPTFHTHGICGSGVQLFIQVPDVDQLYARLKQSVNIVDALEIKSWGDR